jgi:hypothetical protein
MSQIGTFLSGEVLDISTFYEMSVFTDATLTSPPTIKCSNDGISWCVYATMMTPYMYLADLMANKIKIEYIENTVFHYNANLKK